MRLQAVGLDFHRPTVMDNGLVHLSAAGQDGGEVEVGSYVVGLGFERLAVMGDGLIDLPAGRQALARLLWASQQAGFRSIVVR